MDGEEEAGGSTVPTCILAASENVNNVNLENERRQAVDGAAIAEPIAEAENATENETHSDDSKEEADGTEAAAPSESAEGIEEANTEPTEKAENQEATGTDESKPNPDESSTAPSESAAPSDAAPDSAHQAAKEPGPAVKETQMETNSDEESAAPSETAGPSDAASNSIDQETTEPDSTVNETQMETNSDEPPPAPDAEAPDAPDSTAAISDYTDHLTYNPLGIAIFTDPHTSEQFQFDEATQAWIPASAENRLEAVNPYENEHYRWCHDTQQWVAKVAAAENAEKSDTGDDDSAVTETDHYRFDASLGQWIPKASAGHRVVSKPKLEGGDELEHTYTDADGAVFFWDVGKGAWFPQIDDDFMARYQMGYGEYVRSESEGEEDEVELLEKLLASKQVRVDGDGGEVAGAGEVGGEGEKMEVAEKKEEKPTAKRKAPPQPAKWFDLDEQKNTKVYVSNLPADITEEEFIELMSKYGMIFRDPGSNKMKVKLYAEADGQLKGDALCSYIRIESVEMALQMLDGYVLRGKKLRAERAKFQQRGDYNPALKPKKKKKDKEKIKKMQEKLFDWRPEKMRGERSKHERTVVLKNLFTPELFEQEVHLIIDYQRDLREECGKCGTVRKVTVYDQHPEGVATVIMSDPEESDLVVQMMNKRFFGKRQLVAELWDGKTKYKIEESAGDENKRLANWDQFLVEEDNDDDDDDDTNVIGEKSAEPEPESVSPAPESS